MTPLNTHLAANERRAILLLAGFAVAVGMAVWLVSLVLGHPSIGVAVAAAVAGAVAVASWRGADRLVLRRMGAVPVDPRVHARYVNLVDGLCSASGVPRPQLFVADSPALNALACGRSPRRAALVATSGLLEDLSRIELEAVLAHELWHVKAGDTMLATVASATVGLLPMAYDWAVGAPSPTRALVSAGAPSPAGGGAPPAANSAPGPVRTVVRLALVGPATLSAILLRSVLDPGREGRADVRAMTITRFPPGLISALEKMSASPDSVPRRYATAHMWLDSPLSRPAPAGRTDPLDRRLAPTENLQVRIEALREL
jgi:heat shock protein HtpX